MSPKEMTQKEQSMLTPRLRFPEFRDNPIWRERCLKDICQINPSNNELPDTFLYIDLEAVESGKLKTKTLLSKKEAPSRAQRLLSNGDILYQVVRPYQRNNFFFNLSDSYPFVASTGYAQLRAYESSAFLYQAIHTDQFVNRVMSRCTGSSYPAINSSALAEIPLPIPELAEQQKIAECLSTLDELIEAESRKLDALKDYKKGLMQQLFPREGETRPRLRFPEFRSAPEWETDKLGSVCDLYQPVTLSSAELSMTGEYLVYGANGIIGSHNQYNHEDSEIAVTCRGATCGEVTKTKPKSWITGNAMVVKPKSQSLSKDFIFHYFKNHGLKSVISGSAQPQITRAGFSPLVVSFPKPDEQHRIATCLNSLDELIAAQSDRISALQTHKQGLLQQLFP